MKINETLGKYFIGVIAERLAGEDFLVVLSKPSQWDKETQKACARVVWKWDMLELAHVPWDRSDGCQHHLHIRRIRDSTDVEATLVVAGEEVECFRLIISDNFLDM